MNHRRNQLDAAINNLATAIEAEDNPHDMALWAVAALAHRLGVTFALSNANTPLTALADIGHEWADQITEALDDNSDEHAATLRVAWAVVQQLVEDVQRRGLTKNDKGRRNSTYPAASRRWTTTSAATRRPTSPSGISSTSPSASHISASATSSRAMTPALMRVCSTPAMLVIPSEVVVES